MMSCSGSWSARDLGRLLAVAAGVAAMLGCARLSAPRVELPQEIMHATGRSTRPAERREVAAPVAPTPAPPPAAVIPALAGAMTPVNAQAQAPLPTVPLEPRLASLVAREQARLEAMTQGLDQMARWQSSPAGASSRLTGQQAVEALARGTQVSETPTGASARVTWSPLTAQAAAPAPAPMPARVEIVPLDQEARQQMEREATQRALASLRAMVVRTEVAPGKSLADWMREEEIPEASLDDMLRQAHEVRSRFGMDEGSAAHFCEVEVEFDTATLQPLM